MDTWERQRRSFEDTAEAYDRFRPGYPADLFDKVRAYTDLAPNDAILEIGAGNGNGTIHIATWGNPIVALEPAPAMVELARRNLASFDNVELWTTRFEDADLPATTYGLVLCAQAWHWLDPDTRTKRFADVLCAHGTAVLVWNMPVVTEANRSFYLRAQEIYARFASSLARINEMRAPDDIPPHPLGESSLFEDAVQLTHPWEWTLPTERYIALLSTHSPHAALDPQTRERLQGGIAAVIDEEFGGTVTETYVALAGVARRV
jgi:SAM-dependent methyltransferase